MTAPTDRTVPWNYICVDNFTHPHSHSPHTRSLPTRSSITNIISSLWLAELASNSSFFSVVYSLLIFFANQNWWTPSTPEADWSLEFQKGLYSPRSAPQFFTISRTYERDHIKKMQRTEHELLVQQIVIKFKRVCCWLRGACRSKAPEPLPLVRSTDLSDHFIVRHLGLKELRMIASPRLSGGQISILLWSIGLKLWREIKNFCSDPNSMLILVCSSFFAHMFKNGIFRRKIDSETDQSLKAKFRNSTY